MYSQRLTEATGGEASYIFGIQCGLTASVLTYSRLSAGGFTMLPMMASKVTNYSKIGLMYLGFYMLGHSYVMGQFGDRS